MSSKADLLIQMDNLKEFDDESLDQIKSPLTNSFDRSDWIEYAAKLKKLGSRNSDVVEKIPYKLSWIKKYVNPILDQVTLEKEYLTKTFSPATENLEKPFNPDKIILNFKVTEINKSTRRFKGWGTVEMKDLEGEIIIVKGLERIMPILMKRGAPITYGHSNKHVGRLKNYKMMNKAVASKKLPAIEVAGQIFNDYKIDDLAWEDILLAMENDDPVLSLAGTPIGNPSIQCDETECVTLHNHVEVYEWAVMRYKRGQRAANPEAKIFEAIEIEDKNKSVSEIHQKDPVLPAGHQLIDMMMSKSVSCQDRYVNLITAGKTESEAKKTLYRELIKLTTKTDPAKKTPCPEKDIKKGTVVSTDNQLTDVLKGIGDSLAGVNETQKEILSSLQLLRKEKEKEEKEEKEEGNPQVPPPPEEEEEEEKEKEKTEETPPAMTLSKNEALAELAKQNGFHLVAGPAPTATERQITAGLQEVQKKKSMPTSEEMREAVRTQSVTELARKYGMER